MCGRYVLFSAMEQLVGHVDSALPGWHSPQVVDTEPLRPNYNVAPTHIVPIVRMFRGHPTIGPAQWGYPPKTIFNARGETCFDKPTFDGSIPCAFVMNGWYEWVDKTPYFTSRADGEPLCVAGLCKVMDGVLYATIVTVAAVPELTWLHHRMPRLLGSGELEQWLGGTDLPALSQSIDAQLVQQFALTSRRVSREVGKVANNHPGLMEQVEDKEE